MQTAGRAVIFSGVAVALGLALLVAMPLPFMRMMGVAGFLIPIVSILAAATLQPVLLSYYGRRGTARKRVLRGEAVDIEHGILGPARALRSWRSRTRTSIAGTVRSRRRGRSGVLPAADAGLDVRDPALAAVDPRLRRAPAGGRPGRGRAGAGPRATRPSGTVLATPACRPRLATARRRARTRPRGRQPSTTVPTGRYVDPSSTYEQVLRRRPRTTTAIPQAQSFVKRLARPARSRRPGFRPSADVLVGGAPAQGVDFLAPGLHLLPAADRRGARADLPAAAARVPVAAPAAQGGAAEPALGRRELRDARRRLQVGRRARRCSASTSSARSRAGSRSSCSRCSSGSRWTTRCSSSRGCARRGTAATTT